MVKVRLRESRFARGSVPVQGRKLHIGGVQAAEGWEILNIIPGSYVNHVGDAADLSRFEENTFSTLYASHILEHFDYAKELDLVLKEWLRVLAPGGALFLSVPDLDALAALFLSKDLTVNERHHVMRIIFGGHIHEYDYHKAGFNEEILQIYLRDAGYMRIKRMKKFNLFDDGSQLEVKGVPISLNMAAYKPSKSS